MYKLITKGKEFTIPKGNLGVLAIQKAIELNKSVNLDTEQNVIAFFNSLGIEVSE